jgi:hypothetical protein
MSGVKSGQETRSRPFRRLAAMLAVAFLVAGCSIAPASASPSAQPTTTAQPTIAAQPSAAGQASPSPSPSATPSQSPSVGPAPVGRWTGIHWISAGAAFPQEPVTGTGDGWSMQVNVFGWSRGYVGFRTALHVTDSHTGFTVDSEAEVSTASDDGIHWTAGRPLDTADIGSPVGITAVVEGPTGLIAVGRFGRGVCGGSPTVDVLWNSADGLTWTRVPLPADFASSSVYTLDAGSSGYIATGILRDGVTTAVWVSADGRSWHRAPLPKGTAGTVLVDGATSFAGGFVVSGAQEIQVGCGVSVQVPSVWWSADAKSWTEPTLPGAIPADATWVSVDRISDHAVLATALMFDSAAQSSSQRVWATVDGRTWKPIVWPASLSRATVLTTGKRGLIFASPTGDFSGSTIATVDQDLTLATLTMSGDLPTGPAMMGTTALGPTGVVALSSDGLNLWLGVPTAS